MSLHFILRRTEQSNKTPVESLRHYVNVRQSDWAEHLMHVEIMMNNSINATTGKTSTELLFGTSFPLCKSVSDIVPAVTDYLEQIRESTVIARDNYVAAKTKTYGRQ
jgi:hypothetical protein